MPTYEYRCDSCGHQFEEFQKITADPIETCPECSGTVQKLINGGGFILKGDGWYETDYASPSNSPPEKPACKPDKDSPNCRTCPAANSD